VPQIQPLASLPLPTGCLENDWHRSLNGVLFMKRREFITLLGGAAVWPLAARAQQLAMPVIGFLNSASPDGYPHLLSAYRQGLSETGYVEGRNVAIEYRWAHNQYDRLPALAADLVHHRVSVITATGASVRAAKDATATIPIVFNSASDPVEAGLVASLNRPGANLTGVTSLNAQLGPKQLEVLHELIPTATAVALLVNPTNRFAEYFSRNLQAAGHALGLQMNVLHASAESEFDVAFAATRRLQAGALVIATDPLFTSRVELLAALAIRYEAPTIYGYQEFAAAGGLISYGGRIANSYRLVGEYTGRILKGERPADLPVQQATTVQLVINLKTAKALGITVPLPLLGRADQVIE
jgi:putative tryptophan/tyrosine transport system substrate-binding protein